MNYKEYSTDKLREMLQAKREEWQAKRVEMDQIEEVLIPRNNREAVMKKLTPAEKEALGLND